MVTVENRAKHCEVHVLQTRHVWKLKVEKQGAVEMETLTGHSSIFVRCMAVVVIHFAAVSMHRLHADRTVKQVK